MSLWSERGWGLDLMTLMRSSMSVLGAGRSFAQGRLVRLGVAARVSGVAAPVVGMGEDGAAAADVGAVAELLAAPSILARFLATAAANSFLNFSRSSMAVCCAALKTSSTFGLPEICTPFARTSMRAMVAAPALEVCRPAISANLIWKGVTLDEAVDGVHLTVWSEWRERVPASLLNATAACMYEDDDEAGMVAIYARARMVLVVAGWDG